MADAKTVLSMSMKDEASKQLKQFESNYKQTVARLKKAATVAASLPPSLRAQPETVRALAVRGVLKAEEARELQLQGKHTPTPEEWREIRRNDRCQRIMGTD